jgi:hypothetical protein
MALAAGMVLAFFSLGLHECGVAAEEAEIRVACRAICTLSDTAGANGAVGGPMGAMASSFQGVACGAMSDEATQLIQCRDQLITTQMSVADYHCLRDAETLAEARDCDVL